MKPCLIKNMLAAIALMLGASTAIAQTTKDSAPPPATQSQTQSQKADSVKVSASYATLRDSANAYFKKPQPNPLDDVFKDITMSFISHVSALSDLKSEDNLDKYRSHRRTYLFKSAQLSEAYRLRALDFLETMQTNKLLPP